MGLYIYFVLQVGFKLEANRAVRKLFRSFVPLVAWVSRAKEVYTGTRNTNVGNSLPSAVYSLSVPLFTT